MVKTLALQALEDLKAENIVVMDVRGIASFTDDIIVCSGNSKQHVRSIAENLITTAKKAGHQPIGVEGAEIGEWVLVDLANVVVHIMLPATRLYYQLEKLWSIQDNPTDS